MAKTTVTEVCPHCDSENEFEWDVEAQGMQATCQSCGKPLMLCSMCEELWDYSCCSWNEATHSCEHSNS